MVPDGHARVRVHLRQGTGARRRQDRDVGRRAGGAHQPDSWNAFSARGNGQRADHPLRSDRPGTELRQRDEREGG
eukprot:scaffold4349_cov161-Prasinococcus_capsulatus_cf.AAC.1